MKIDYQSDLHLEFGGPELDLGTGDVLVLAGDILTARNLDVHPSSPKRQFYSKFIDRASKHYEHVIWVAGNHEHYGHSIDKTPRDIKAFSPPNVHYLEREEIVIGDWIFLGTTLWTSLRNNDPMVAWDLTRYMHDFKSITINQGKFLPSKWWNEYCISFKWLCEKTVEYSDKKICVITHHAPSFQSIADMYRTDTNKNINYGYFTPLDYYIEEHPQIKFWIHGHTHTSSDYMVGSTRVLCNPRGYFGTNDLNPEFNLTPGLILD